MYRVDLNNLSNIFATDPNVVAAWAFGSAKDGTVGKESDIDIAVLFACKPSLDERRNLADALERRLKRAPVDLVVLNGASAVLRFEALSGRKIYSTDMESEATFQSLAAREYEYAIWLLKRGLKWRQEALLQQTPT